MVRYALELCPNKEYGYVHLSVRPPEIPWISSTITEEGKALKARLESIPGVEEVTCHGHRLGVRRGGVFTFDELFPQVLEVLQDVLRLGEIEEVPAYM